MLPRLGIGDQRAAARGGAGNEGGQRCIGSERRGVHIKIDAGRGQRRGLGGNADAITGSAVRVQALQQHQHIRHPLVCSVGGAGHIQWCDQGLGRCDGKLDIAN